MKNPGFKHYILTNAPTTAAVIIFLVGAVSAANTPAQSEIKQALASDTAENPYAASIERNAVIRQTDAIIETGTIPPDLSGERSDDTLSMEEADSLSIAISARYYSEQRHGYPAGTQLKKTPSEFTLSKQETRLPRYFESIEEARSWLDSHHLPIRLITGQDGEAAFTNKPNPRYDCDDYALEFQQKALEDGYLINLCPVVNGLVWNVKVTELMEYHIACFVQIDNTYYYIETVPGMDNSFKLTRILNAD